MDDSPRLIERAFPLKQASLDSVHEKNIRHGHLSTLHIWPARRPLAACRAALIATLLPDPGTPEARQELCEKIGGKLVKKIERKKMPSGEIVEREREETVGGILHWGRETEDMDLLNWCRREVQKAYEGRVPKMLDPFAGGGAIPLEAMRLGCEVTAVDINPVAWFILKCTLEYPQKLAGKLHPLPKFILADRDFMKDFYLANPEPTDQKGRSWVVGEGQGVLPYGAAHANDNESPNADLAWHIRAWGRWVLAEARRELAKFYPTYADFEPLDKTISKPYERVPIRLVPLREDGRTDGSALNSEFGSDYLAQKRNPRWIAKPTVAYLWARTVKCKNCRATIPLLKTRWLCKKDKSRVLLGMEPNEKRTGVVFSIESNVPTKNGNAAPRRDHDKCVGAGTMSRSGAKCPCCSTIMTKEDIRLEGQSGKIEDVNTAVVVDGPSGKEYRLPSQLEISWAQKAVNDLATCFGHIPFGMPDEPTPKGGSGASRAFSVDGYGIDKWSKLFTPRQLLALGTLIKWTRKVYKNSIAEGYPNEWANIIQAYLACGVDKQADRLSSLCRWDQGYTKISSTFTRFALPIMWDYCEGNPFSSTTGNYLSCLEWVAEYINHGMGVNAKAQNPSVINQSAIKINDGEFDLILTDPPYYDAIPYSDLMDFFYLWLRRTLSGVSDEFDKGFKEPLSPKWSNKDSDGELIDDASRHGNDRIKSKAVYEEGMSRVFLACQSALKPNGRMIVVFAHKNPDAWETLTSAIMKAGFVVDGSWPIQTEMGNRSRAHGSAALASSVWLVCKKRPMDALPGWDNQVLGEMRNNIRERLREFWDAGIRGPDFVWAATGPALEAYSRHPVVKKANEPGTMTVSDFLAHVRRMVVDFVVGRVLSGNGFVIGGEEDDTPGQDRLDEPTAYYLLHRHDFGLEDAPSGACILYAISCGVSDKELADTWDIIAFTKGKTVEEIEEEEQGTPTEQEVDTAEESGAKVKLKTWNQRRGKSLGYEAPGGRPIPLIDRVHRLMHLWKAGNLSKVDEYLDDSGLRRQELFKRLLQSLIELALHGSEERSLLESISNHIQARGAIAEETNVPLAYDIGTDDEENK